MKQIRLTEEEIANRLFKLHGTGWERSDKKWIEKKYRFETFPEALQFVMRVGEEAERRIHHPLIAIDYRVVTLRLTTWSAGGLTELDFGSAGAYEAFYEENHMEP